MYAHHSNIKFIPYFCQFWWNKNITDFYWTISITFDPFSFYIVGRTSQILMFILLVEQTTLIIESIVSFFRSTDRSMIIWDFWMNSFDYITVYLYIRLSRYFVYSKSRATFATRAATSTTWSTLVVNYEQIVHVRKYFEHVELVIQARLCINLLSKKISNLFIFISNNVTAHNTLHASFLF